MHYHKFCIMPMVYVLVSYFLEHQLQHYKYILFIDDELEGILNVVRWAYCSLRLKWVNFLYRNYDISVVCLNVYGYKINLI